VREVVRRIKPIFQPTSFIISLDEGREVPYGLGPILSAQPIIEEARKLGFELEEGDGLVWKLKKTKNGRLKIEATIIPKN